MNEVEAGLALSRDDYIDYLEGRVIKTNFPVGAKELDVTLYDRDNGEGAAEQVIDKYRRRVEGMPSAFYIPLKFMGVDRRKYEDDRGRSVFAFDVLGGKLVVMDGYNAFFMPCSFMYFEMSIPGENRYLKSQVEIDPEHCRIDGREYFRHEVMRLIHGVLEELSKI